MRLINLNTWGGIKFDSLIQYVKDSASHTDIFCFQEILNSQGVETGDYPHRLTLMDDFRKALPDFIGLYNEMLSAKSLSKDGAGDVTFGNAIFVRKGIHVVSTGGLYIFGQRQEYSTQPQRSALAQYATLQSGRVTFLVCNVHGIAFWPKSDSPERDEQIGNMLHFLNNNAYPKVVCGDFNMLPDTRGIALMGGTMRNLVNEYGISVTRSEFHYEKYGRAPEVDSISDYVFVSPEITTLGFSVPQLLISDHLPMELDFSVTGTTS